MELLLVDNGFCEGEVGGKEVDEVSSDGSRRPRNFFAAGTFLFDQERRGSSLLELLHPLAGRYVSALPGPTS